MTMDRMFDQLGQFFGQDQTRQQEYREFERRYREDPDSISDAEAARRYREMMAQMNDDDDYADDEVFGRLSPQERRMMAERFQQATRDPSRPYQGYPPNMDLDEAAQPRNLGRMSRQAAREDGDLLEQLVGPDSPLNSTGAKLALAGGAAYLASRFFGRR
jgi:hypothetical protein